MGDFQLQIKLNKVRDQKRRKGRDHPDHEHIVAGAQAGELVAEGHPQKVQIVDDAVVQGFVVGNDLADVLLILLLLQVVEVSEEEQIRLALLRRSASGV